MKEINHASIMQTSNFCQRIRENWFAAWSLANYVQQFCKPYLFLMLRLSLCASYLVQPCIWCLFLEPLLVYYLPVTADGGNKSNIMILDILSNLRSQAEALYS